MDVELSNHKADEDVLVALAFASNEEEEYTARATLLGQKWWQEAAPSDQEDQEEECASQAAPSDHQDSKHDDVTESVERAIQAAPQAQEEFETTLKSDIVCDSVVEAIPQTGSELFMQAVRHPVPDDWPPTLGGAKARDGTVANSAVVRDGTVANATAALPTSSEYELLQVSFELSTDAAGEWHDAREDDDFYDCAEREIEIVYECSWVW